MSWATVYLSYF